jgi:hypothetical protein
MGGRFPTARDIKVESCAIGVIEKVFEAEDKHM